MQGSISPDICFQCQVHKQTQEKKHLSHGKFELAGWGDSIQLSFREEFASHSIILNLEIRLSQKPTIYPTRDVTELHWSLRVFLAYMLNSMLDTRIYDSLQSTTFLEKSDLKATQF